MAGVEWNGEGEVGPTGQEGEPSTHRSARCSKEAKTGIQLPFCVPCSLKALWNWVGTAGENSMCLPG